MMLQDKEDLIQALKNNCVLSEHHEEIAEYLQPRCSPVIYQKNTHFHIQSDNINNVLLLAYGALLETINNENGDERAIDIIKPGRAIGDYEVLSDSSMDMSMKLITSCKFFKIQASDYLSIIEKYNYWKKALKCCQARISKTKKHLTALQLSNHEQKIKWAINQLRDKETNKLIARNIDIASVIGCSKETVSRVMPNLSKD